MKGGIENVLTDFEKCECCAAMLDSCASNKRNNQIQNKLIKNIIKYKLYTNMAKDNRWLEVVISKWFVWN